MVNEGCSGSAQGPKLSREKPKIGQQLAVARELAAGCSVRGRREGRLLVSAVEKRRQASIFVGPCSRLVVARLLTSGARGEGKKKEKGEEGK